MLLRPTESVKLEVVFVWIPPLFHSILELTRSAQLLDLAVKWEHMYQMLLAELVTFIPLPTQTPHYLRLIKIMRYRSKFRTGFRLDLPHPA